MGSIDLLWHLLNFIAVAIGLALVASAGVKLLWRRRLSAVRWRNLGAIASAASTAMLVVGLIAFGRDGLIATYVLMVFATAGALWWAGFGRGRR